MRFSNVAFLKLPCRWHRRRPSSWSRFFGYFSRFDGIGSGGLHCSLLSSRSSGNQTPTAVVCAGAKSILDVGSLFGAFEAAELNRSVVLWNISQVSQAFSFPLNDLQETQSVTVATYGLKRDFPAFYSATSGFQSPYNVTSPEEAAELMLASERLQASSGILFAVPIPQSEEARAASIQQAVEQAVRESEESGQASKGKDVTPWLLSRVKELSQGSSVISSESLCKLFQDLLICLLDIALIKNNTEVACQIAKAYQDLKVPSKHMPVQAAQTASPPPELLVVGGAAVDITAQSPLIIDEDGADDETVGTTVPGRVRVNAGGVARNMAEAAHRLGASVQLATCFNPQDSYGTVLTQDFDRLQLPVHNFDGAPRTAVGSLVLDRDGSLVRGVADMDDTFDAVSATAVSRFIDLSKTLLKSF